MENFAKVTIVAIAMATVSQASEAREWKLKVSMDQYTTHYFENQLDHFNSNDDRSYKQRYWYNDGFKVDNGPCFLYICGEWTCSPPDDQMFPMMVGAEHGALLYSLEHRYYGDSQPFEDWSTDNLEWLKSEQALADIAKFIEGQNEWLGYEADWIVIGGSYPGALSAWFKSQYPDHAVGSWSSSGVIHAIEDFKTFDLDIFMRLDDSGPACTDTVKEALVIAEHKWETEEGRQELADLFEIDMSLQNEFWYFYADIFTAAVQYGTRVPLCEAITAARDEGPEALMNELATQAKNSGLSYSQYDARLLSDTTIDINSSLRQWTYQYCNEFGFFQVPNDQQPMRSHFISYDFWPDYCSRVFGRKIDTKSEWTNKHYGGLDIEGDNIFFLNGSEDPWQYAAMREVKHPKTSQKNMNSAYIKCDSCAHCVDFRTPTPDQAQSLTDAQNAVADEVAKWLSEAEEKRQKAIEEKAAEPDFSDLDYEKKGFGTDESLFEGNGSNIFLQ